MARELMARKNLKKNLQDLLIMESPSDLLIKFMIEEFVKELEVSKDLEELRQKVLQKLRKSIKRSRQSSVDEPKAKRICEKPMDNVIEVQPVFQSGNFRIPKKSKTPPLAPTNDTSPSNNAEIPMIHSYAQIFDDNAPAAQIKDTTNSNSAEKPVYAQVFDENQCPVFEGSGNKMPSLMDRLKKAGFML
ncbi:hypothetical protein CAEBREN_25345 [Caenorhabditis brenneri]|uniref:Uncharacterized protein n=1 Tax=Caenorhabditis brenneri TaxID=135651 RepID=G0NGS1_CAEBE|nr:hypothetical protein CAEBREN_25345 [Caenorhabditis brenneri]